MNDPQTTSRILMVRPTNFRFNEQTASSNAFMDILTKHQKVHHKAVREFDDFVDKLRRNAVDVTVSEDQPNFSTPDSIFPNNWLSTHSDGTVFIYPMEAENRRVERRSGALEEIGKKFIISQIIDLSHYESEQKFLEGTGSLVLDREKQVAYACISSRTHVEVMDEFCRYTGYKPIVFEAHDQSGAAIYHTNVMMCIGESFVVICLDAIRGLQERLLVSKSLEDSGRNVIAITLEQLQHFAGNMIELKNKFGNSLLVMSEQAFKALSADQIHQLEKYGKPLFSPLYTIESTGGGSARCMIAEIFLAEQVEDGNT